MSRGREQPFPGFATHGSGSSWTNAGFDDPLRAGDHVGTSDSFSHGGHVKTDWKKKANEMCEEYLSGCPGASRTNEHSASTGHSTEQSDPLMNVCSLVVMIIFIIC